MMPRAVAFATPSLDARVALEYNRSHSETQTLLTQAGIIMYMLNVAGNSFVHMARNALVSDYLQDPNLNDVVDFFFLDDDIGWPAQKVLEFIARDEDIVAGIYPKKNDNNEYPVDLVLNSGCLVERQGLVKAAMAPTGFMRIKRHVLQKFYDDAPEYVEQTTDGLQARRNIFKAGFIDGVGWRGEDYQFCMEWTEKYGGEIWVDPNIDFTHRGNKKWSGNFYRRILQMIDEQRLRDRDETHNVLGLAAD